jgi:hypothetical protein
MEISQSKALVAHRQKFVLGRLLGCVRMLGAWVDLEFLDDVAS